MDTGKRGLGGQKCAHALSSPLAIDVIVGKTARQWPGTAETRLGHGGGKEEGSALGMERIRRGYAPPADKLTLLEGVTLWRRRAGVLLPETAGGLKLDCCTGGRADWRGPGGELCLLEPGRVGVNLPETALTGQGYEGVTFLLDTEKAAGPVDRMARQLLGRGLDLAALAGGLPPVGRLLPDGCGAVYLGELHRDLQAVYGRVKLLELLVLLERRTGGGPGTAAGQDCIRRIRDDLTGRLGQRQTLEEVCRTYHVSLSWLKRNFKKTYGMPVHAYLQQRRMETACRLLRSGAQSVGEIAQQVGYDSQSRFSAAFRAYMGESPRDYRNRAGEVDKK